MRKKYNILSAVMLSVICMCFFMFTACGNNTEDSEGSSRPVNQDAATLYDVYEEDRPDYGFDFKSDYERPDPLAQFTLTFSADCGVKFKDGVTSVKLLRGDPMPEYTDETGKTIIGWYDIDASASMWSVGMFSMPPRNVEIAPYFAPANGAQALVAGSGKDNKLPDYFQDKNNTNLDSSIPTVFSQSAAIVGGEKGQILSHSGTLAVGDKFRMISHCGDAATESGIIKNKRYKFQFHLENKGNTDIVIEVIQVQTEMQITSEQGAVSSGELTLVPGVTQSFSIEIVLTKDNKNALTVFLVKENIENMKLGIALSKINNVIVNPEAKHTLTIAARPGITFAGGGLTAEIAGGAALPEIVNTTGRTIAGWYSDSYVWAVGKFSMPENALTISPYFEKLNGYMDIVPLSAQRTTPQGIPSNLSPNLDKYSFASSTSALLDVNNVVVNGGANGYAELGKTIKYTGIMANESEFRANSIVDANNTVVKKGVVHGFRYNFENKGTENIDLLMYQVNTENYIETGDAGHRILLAPGESMEIAFMTGFAKGSDNKNILTLFKVNVAGGMNGINLGMSISFKLGTV